MEYKAGVCAASGGGFMAGNAPSGTMRITPYLAYADAPAAIEFLCQAFGFEERFRLPMEDGRIGHAELGYGSEVVLFLASAYAELGLESPQALGGVHAQVHCRIDDVDAHYQRARAAGATILDAPRDQPYGDRMYRALDPEGHRFMFASRIRDLPPEQLADGTGKTSRGRDTRSGGERG
jgi:PhnB protein